MSGSTPDRMDANVMRSWERDPLGLWGMAAAEEEHKVN
jgi:hypothetical protein